MNGVPRSDILDSFEKSMGSGKFLRIGKKVLKVDGWTSLKDIARKEFLSAIILDINPVTLKDIKYKDIRRLIPYRLISSKLELFYKNNPLVQYAISKGHDLSPLEIGKLAVIGAELEKFYRLGCSDSQVLSKLGSAYSLQDIMDITKLIWDTDPDGARKLLHTGLLNS